MHPLRPDLPIHLAAEGPKNVALAAEIADGWLPLFFSPRLDAEHRLLLGEGFAARDARLRPASDFEVSPTVPVVVDEDVERAADRVRPFVALYLGGMGAPTANFHRSAIERLGWVQECSEVARLWSEGDRGRAAAAVPTALVQDIALVGPVEAIRDRLDAWRETSVTSLLVQGDRTALRTMAELVL